MATSYKECNRCVLCTNDDPEITFDTRGNCNYCQAFDERKLLAKSTLGGEKEWRSLAEQIKKEGEGKKYDSIMGVSGGVDSTYLAYVAKQYGLRPLVIHFDNGWNSETAVHNIEYICQKLGFDLFTYVVDWDEFRDIQLAYFKASVVDIEFPNDHGIFAAIAQVAQQFGLKYILVGHNVATEGVLPKAWRWSKMDLLNLISIHRKYGTLPLRKFPTLGFFKKIWLEVVLGFKWIHPLNYLPYSRAEAKHIITTELGWRDYGGKHCESIFTRFYQSYILPRKFGIDKRRAHLSSMICDGQITKSEAIEELKKPPYESEQLKLDMAFVLKKFGWTQEEFERLMNTPPRPHDDFPTYLTKHYLWHERLFSAIRPITTFFRLILRKPKKARL